MLAFEKYKAVVFALPSQSASPTALPRGEPLFAD